mmetsp:Transcript_24050/g.36997  ORF Transcript_24050/g.36997 Transcript_24050/m.36997 type:complete len:84 (-) Transcript_24050:371-622(-)|eukprot:CAMPEP_0170483864 /NCGR_PEP_ID=MMETSP0208-20121228/3465_1 /TAXON_ID=197538 /ORGANISM="Strombidium inclinatum, Strain S3" /LENGTH=83 /DNA_ID=CAMNT_0010757049 /DNA_START=298 /DNA_END=549 /DNA_ORIENTATION=-
MNYHELKEEVLTWPRIGTKRAHPEYPCTKDEKTGFLATSDVYHAYEGIEEDVEKLKSQGYLVEFHGHESLVHECITKKYKHHE